MSLLDPIVVCDAVLQTVMQQDVYVAIRTDNPSTTPADWFRYGHRSVRRAKRFRRLVRLCHVAPSWDWPGNRPNRTRNVPDRRRGWRGGNQGWAARSGLRILGSGIAQTTIKLVNPSTNQMRWAVGMPTGLSTGASPLDGFEASDFSVNCGFTDAENTAGYGAVCVYGTHVYLRRIRAINFGSNDSSAFLTVFLFAHRNSEDCVLSECVADTVATGNSANVILFGVYNGNGPAHRFCVVRNCWGQAKATTDPLPAVSDSHKGIWPGYGIGTIIEGNVILNVGPAVAGIACATNDLVIRDNYFRNVHYGVSWNEQSGAAVGRIIAVSNVIDLTTSPASPVGLQFTGDLSATRYGTLILRKNVIRDVANGTNSITGINVTQCTNLDVESNVIDNSAATAAVLFSGVTATKFFNNRTSAGLLLRAYDGSAFIPELEDLVKSVPLVLLST